MHKCQKCNATVWLSRCSYCSEVLCDRCMDEHECDLVDPVQPKRLAYLGYGSFEGLMIAVATGALILASISYSASVAKMLTELAVISILGAVLLPIRLFAKRN